MTRVEMLKVLFMEEASEIAQGMSKCLRFGDNQKEIDTTSTAKRPDLECYTVSNIQLVRNEIIDLFTIIEMLEEENVSLMPDYKDLKTFRKISDKREKVEAYLLLSETLGTLKEEKSRDNSSN